MAADGKKGQTISIVKDIISSPKTFVTGFWRAGGDASPMSPTSPVSLTLSTTPMIGKEGVVTEIPVLPCPRAKRVKDLGMNQVALCEGMAALCNCLTYLSIGKTPLSSPGVSPTGVGARSPGKPAAGLAADGGLPDAQLLAADDAAPGSAAAGWGGLQCRRLPREDAGSIADLGANQEGLMLALEQLRDTCSAITSASLDDVVELKLPHGSASSRQELAENQRALYAAITSLRQPFEQIGGSIGLPPPLAHNRCRSLQELAENQLMLRQGLVLLQMAVDKDSALASMHEDQPQEGQQGGAAWLCRFW